MSKRAKKKPAIRVPGGRHQHQHRLFVDRSAPGAVWACVCGERFLQLHISQPYASPEHRERIESVADDLIGVDPASGDDMVAAVEVHR